VQAKIVVVGRFFVLLYPIGKGLESSLGKAICI